MLKDLGLREWDYPIDISLIANFINQCKNLENLIISMNVDAQNIIKLLKKLNLNKNLNVYIIVENMYFSCDPSELQNADLKYTMNIRIYNKRSISYTELFNNGKITNTVFETMKNYANSDKFYELVLAPYFYFTLGGEKDINELMNKKNMEKITTIMIMNMRLNFDPLKTIIQKLKSLNIINLFLDIDIENFNKGFSELIPYLNKTKIPLKIIIDIDFLKPNIWNFIKNLLIKLKNAISYQLTLKHIDGKDDNMNYEDFKQFINKICKLKKDKLLDNLYSINIRYPNLNEVLKMDDFKECLSDLLLGYPKFILSNK